MQLSVLPPYIFTDKRKKAESVSVALIAALVALKIKKIAILKINKSNCSVLQGSFLLKKLERYNIIKSINT